MQTWHERLKNYDLVIFLTSIAKNVIQVLAIMHQNNKPPALPLSYNARQWWHCGLTYIDGAGIDVVRSTNLYVEPLCYGLSCPPYHAEKELTCVIFTR